MTSPRRRANGSSALATALMLAALSAPPAGLLAPSSGRADPGVTPTAPAIARPLADGGYLIHRATLLPLVDEPDRLAGEVWLAWPGAERMKALARGEKVRGPAPPTGLELRGIRPGSPIHGLGLRSGDVLQRLDGAAIDGLPILIAVGWRLRARLLAGGGWDFEAGISRAGKPLVLRYRVDGGARPEAAAPEPAPTEPAAPEPPAPEPAAPEPAPTASPPTRPEEQTPWR